MKHLLLLLICLAAIGQPVRGDDPPPVSELEKIDVFAGAWRLNIYPDGSAQIGFGSNAGDFARVPAGTFDFTKVYKSISGIVIPSGNIHHSFVVFFCQANVSPSHAQYTNKTETLLPLLETALQKRHPINGKDRLTELWKQNPPTLKK